MRPLATFFIFFETFSFFHSPRRSFLIAPSSSSLLPPRPSFVLVLPSSSSLFLPRPALSKSFRIRNRPFFINFDESVTDQRTNGPTNGRTDKASYRDARTHLKRSGGISPNMPKKVMPGWITESLRRKTENVSSGAEVTIKVYKTLIPTTSRSS